MTTILAFDTATEKVSAALAIDGAVVDEVRLDEANRHTERLISIIDDILCRAGLAWRARPFSPAQHPMCENSRLDALPESC